MSAEVSENGDVYNHFLEISKPTKEDFDRVFTQEELKELCLRHKCTVDMWRWNVVNDYRRVFTESGRYQRWSERDRLRMLTKAVNKMKPSVLYSEEDIKKTRKEEWGLQLKENILSLNFWQRKRLNNPRTQVELLDYSFFEVNTESMNAAGLLTQSERQESQVENTPPSREIDEYVELQIEVNTESMNGTQSQRQALVSQIQLNTDEQITPTLENELPIETIQTTKWMHTQVRSAESEAENVLVAEEYLVDDSVDSVETVLFNMRQEQPAVQTLNSEEVAPEIADIYAVNTMSMTIDSQMSTQTQDLPAVQWQDVIPQNYDNFKNVIPLTSTQSQNHESEEI